MEIVSIFDLDNPRIGASHYEGDNVDIFTQLLRNWHNRSYLSEFFLKNMSDLNDYWKLSIDDAVKYVIDEVDVFEEELIKIQARDEGYEDFDMTTLFEKYHEKEFAIRKKGEHFRKARPDLNKPMLRLYAIELQDGYIVTGGCIKLTHQLNNETKHIIESQLNKTQDYINANKIVSLLDL